uniref:Small basic protein n=1 Tax=Chicken calicivirus TaxID=1172196 RepID=I0DHL8_9CALI|nr:small basic protein [Chicken calicivirus]
MGMESVSSRSLINMLAALGAGLAAVSQTALGIAQLNQQDRQFGEQIKVQQDQFNKQLQASLAMPFLNAAATVELNNQIFDSRLGRLRAMGASAGTPASVAAGQPGVIVNGNYGVAFHGQSAAGLATSYPPLPNLTLNYTRGSSENPPRRFDSSYSLSSASRRDSVLVGPGRYTSRRTSVTSIGSTISTGSTASALNNYYQFGFLNPNRANERWGV